MSENITNTTDANFDSDVLQSNIPVLVDFLAEWCNPCRMVAPILEQIAEDFKGKIKIVKMDVDKNPNTPSQYGVRGIPNLILFKDGEVIASKVGALSKSQLTTFLNEYC